MTPAAVHAAVNCHFGGAFVWGARDCAACVCAALRDLGLGDYRREFVWAGEAEGRAILAAVAGGLPRIAGRVLRRDGWRLRGDAVPGAVGVTVTPEGPGLALSDGTWFYAKSAGGFVAVRRARIIWGPPCPSR